MQTFAKTISQNKSILIGALFVGMCIWLLAITTDVAWAQDPLCSDPEFVAKNTEYCKPSGENPFWGEDGLLTKVTEVVSMLVGIASVIMVVVGALRIALSGGDSSKLASARNTIIYAIVGLVIAVMARIFLVYILRQL